LARHSKHRWWRYNSSLWRATMFTATADLILPSTTTGSFPRPRWCDVSMWGRPLDTCMLDVRFREKFQDAMSVVISDQERVEHAGVERASPHTHVAPTTPACSTCAFARSFRMPCPW